MKPLQGKLVSARALKWWPYLSIAIEEINEAAQETDWEKFYNVFMDLARIIGKERRVFTKGELEKKLDDAIRQYKSGLKQYAQKKKRLGEHHSGLKPLQRSTASQYTSHCKNWKLQKDKERAEIKAIAKDLGVCRRGKIFEVGGVPFKLIYGGQYEAKFNIVDSETGVVRHTIR